MLACLPERLPAPSNNIAAVAAGSRFFESLRAGNIEANKVHGVCIDYSIQSPVKTRSIYSISLGEEETKNFSPSSPCTYSAAILQTADFRLPPLVRAPSSPAAQPYKTAGRFSRP